MRDGYVFHIDGPLSLFSATTKYGLQVALVPAGALALPGLPPRRRAPLGPEARAPELPPRGERRPDLAPGRHRHLRPGRAGRVRRAVPPGRPGLGDHREHRRDRAGPRRRLGPRLPARPQSPPAPTSCSRSSASGSGRASSGCCGSCPSTVRPRFVLAISDRLKVDEEALQELQGPILRFKEIPNASELAALLDTFLERPGGDRPLFG